VIPLRFIVTHISADASTSKNGGSPEWSDNAKGNYKENRSNELERSDGYSGPSPTGSPGYPSLQPPRRPRSTSIPSTSRPGQVSVKSVRFTEFLT
jgi:hypothetical protein